MAAPMPGTMAATAEAGAGLAGPFFAPAKVNLYLRVTGRRSDGYHSLDSLALPVSLADRLWLAPAPRDRLELGGPFAPALAATPEGDNLALRALALAAAFIMASGEDAALAAAEAADGGGGETA